MRAHAAAVRPVDRASLPDDAETLKDMLMELGAALHALRQQASAQRASLAAQLAEFKRQVFGPRGEALSALQPELWQHSVEFPVPPERLDEVKGHRRRRQGRPAIDAELPRRRVEHDLSEDDKAGFLRVVRIGEEISETLEYTPARLEVLQHARLKYRCEDAAGGSTIRTASAQTSPIARSNAGAGLLAHVMVSKYADHCPLARQERILARHGARVSRQTLCDWTLGAAELLGPLMASLKRHVLGSAVIFTDDTTLALKAPRGDGRARTITARLWVYLAGGWLPDAERRWRRVAPAALYDFSSDRSGEHPRRILGAWRGFLQADDFAGYAQSFRDGLTHAACLVHARRRFAKIVQNAPKGSPPGLAHEALKYFAEVYRIEGDIRAADPDERLRGRQCQTKSRDGGLPTLAGRACAYAAAQVAHRGGVGLCLEQLGRAQHLHRARHPRGRQQPQRARHRAGRAVEEELALRGLRTRRQGRGHRLQPHRDGAPERRGALCLPARRARAHQWASPGPARGVAADALEAGMTPRTPPMQDTALIDALNKATSLELYQLGALVERLITDPRRIVEIRKVLHMGQLVRFYDAKHDKLRQGRIVEMRDAQLTLRSTEVQGEWKLPYAALETPEPGAKVEPPQPAAPTVPKPTRADFQRGDKVSFTDRHLQLHVGVITRCNPKTASIETDGTNWSVPYDGLRQVLDL